jgi:hypothetical protein
MSQPKSKSILEAEFLLDHGISICVFLRLSPAWVRPTHLVERNILFSKSTDINITTNEEYLHIHSHIRVWSNIWVIWLVKLTKRWPPWLSSGRYPRNVDMAYYTKRLIQYTISREVGKTSVISINKKNHLKSFAFIVRHLYYNSCL